jgi:hypothetical protein
MEKDWLHDPRISQISPAKRALLESLIEKSRGKKQKDLLPFLTAAMAEAKKQNVTLTSGEASLLIEVFMENLTPEEKEKAKQVLNLAKKAKKQAKEK